MNSRNVILSLLFVFALCFAGYNVYANDIDVDVRFYDEFGRIYGICSGNLETTVTVSNKTEESISVMTFNALYNGDKLMSVKYNSDTIYPDSEKTICTKTDVGSDVSASTLVTIVTDDNLNPLSKPQYIDCESGEKMIDEKLAKIKSCYDEGLLQWLAYMYNPNIGGMYYSNSSRVYNGFAPDIESTSQFLNICEVSGLKPANKSFRDFFGEDFSNKITNYIKTRQSQENGYFYDPQYPQSKVSTSKRERNLTQAKVMLTRFEDVPLYPYPEDRLKEVTLESSSLPDYLQTEEKFKAWMEALPWESTPYPAANQLSAHQYTANSLGYTPTIVSFLKSIQNKDTGLWGEGLTYEALNASLKVSVYFNPETERYPLADRMLKSLSYILENNILPPQTASELWNPVTLVNFAKESGAFDDDLKESYQMRIPTVLSWLAKSLGDFKKDDGGFSYGRLRSTPLSQNMPVSLGLVESDMNATMLCVNVWDKCCAVAGRPAEALFTYENQRRFLQLINSASEIPKSEPPENVYTENFEGCSNIYDALWTIYGPTNALTFDKDNHCAIFNPNAQDNENVQSIVPVYTNKRSLSKIRFEAKINLINSDNNPLYYNSLNNMSDGGAVQWLIVGKNGGYTINNRSTASGVGEVMTPLLQKNKWYTLTIDYEPVGNYDTKITYSIDGNVTTVTNCYSGYGARAPVSFVDTLTFRSFKGSNSILMLDDIKVYAY